MNIKGVELVLTKGCGERKSDTILSLYKKRNIAEGFDTYDKISTKQYGNTKETISWRSRDGVTDIVRNWEPSPNNLKRKTWSNNFLYIDDTCIKAMFDKDIDTLRVKTFEFKQLTKNFTSKALRAIRLLNKITK